METLVNSQFLIEIEMVDQICGGNQFYEIFFTAANGVKYKLTFDFVWDMRCAVENAYLMRSFRRCVKENSSILLVQNSDYVKYFEEQICGTYPTDELKHFIIFDRVDTIIELLTTGEPELTEIEEL